jgi:2-C-methyl-D-erythritol 4-phosphate cytidylyltransferase
MMKVDEGGRMSQRMTVGVVPLEGRGSLPFVDLHHEALFLHAVRALLEVDRVAGHVVVTVDPDQGAAAAADLDRTDLPALVKDARGWWRTLGAGRVGPVTVVMHDPLCPLVPASFLAACLDDTGAADVRRGAAGPGGDGALVAFRPVTDTIKTVVDDQIVGTLDREVFGVVASPVVFDHRHEHTAPQGLPPTADFGALVAWLRAQGPVSLRKAPSLGRRVDDPSAVNLLECMDEMARMVQET